jgi:hypothetical protein
MANSMTEHSKKLRAKTANEYNKRMLKEGKIKQISLRLTPELADEFNALLAQLGESKAKGIQAIVEHYKNL